MTRFRSILARWREQDPPRFCHVITSLPACCCDKGPTCGAIMSRLRYVWSGDCGRHGGSMRQVAGDNAVQIQIGNWPGAR